MFFTGAGMIHAVLLIMQPDGPDHILSPLRSASERASAVSQRPTLVMNSDVSCMFPVQAGDAHAHCVYMCEVCMYHGSQNRAPEQGCRWILPCTYLLLTYLLTYLIITGLLASSGLLDPPTCVI